MRNFGRISATILLYVACATCVTGQTPDRSAIRITLSDEIGNAIVGATVRAIAADGKELTAVSNNDGIAELRGLKVGAYRVTVESDGFKMYKNDSVDLKPNETKKLDIAMQLADRARCGAARIPAADCRRGVRLASEGRCARRRATIRTNSVRSGVRRSLVT